MTAAASSSPSPSMRASAIDWQRRCREQPSLHQRRCLAGRHPVPGRGASTMSKRSRRSAEALTIAAVPAGLRLRASEPRLIATRLAHAINITYVIDEGPRIYIERINIVGNFRTHDDVIRREFRWLKETPSTACLSKRPGDACGRWDSLRPWISTPIPAAHQTGSSSSSRWSSSRRASSPSAPAIPRAKA